MPRVSPIRSVLEWLGAAAIVVGVVWLASGQIRQWTGPRPAVMVEAEPSDIPGVPVGATAVPLLVLLDGTEIRVGDAHARLVEVVDERHATAPSQTTRGEYGERWTRPYHYGPTRFIVVCERRDPSEVLEVAAIYLP